MQLTRVELKNYRCFEKHTVSLSDLTLLIGPNNAGKTTVVEALRLLAHVLKRVGRLAPSQRPDWVDLPWTTKGLSPSIRDLDIFSPSICHQFGDPPAEVIAHFGTAASVHIYVHPDGDLFATIHGRRGELVQGKTAMNNLGLPHVRVLPRVGPVLLHEPQRDPDYVARNTETHRSPRLFRNQLDRFHDHFDQFATMAQDSWPGLTIHEFRRTEDNEWFLSIRDGAFVGELGWMGSGLQMWLQVIWFLALCDQDDIVVLDEPDIYMHADLQQRLVRMVQDQYEQVIIATHSTEMIAAVEPANLLFIDRGQARSRTADTLAEVDDLLSEIGPQHNLQIARLLSAKKCLLVEGKDLEILGSLCATVFPASRMPLARVPSWPIHGWGGWELQSIWAQQFRAANSGTRVYCLLDRDYHQQSEVDERLNQAESRAVDLHIWQRKEIENYLLSPGAILRRLTRGARRNKQLLTSELVADKLASIAEDMYDFTLGKIADGIARSGSHLEPSTALRRAQQRLDPEWEDPAERLRVVSGKEVLKRLSAWSQETFDTGLTGSAIARTMRREEIPDEMRDVLTAIERGNPF